VGLGWLVDAYSSHSLHKAKEVGPQSTNKEIGCRHKRGLVPGMEGDNFASEPGGMMKVAMWLWATLLVGL
jgi:hypothetical protein